jgi:hypothetical protein
VRCVVRQVETVVDVTDGISEWPSARNDEQRNTSARLGDLGQDGLEVFDAGQQTTTDSYDYGNAQISTPGIVARRF